MRIFTYFFLIIFLLVSSSNTFANPNHSTFQDDDALLQKVYQKLKDVLNVSNRDLPTIRLTGRTDNIGSYTDDKNLLEIEQEAFNVCKRFGTHQEHAIAYLIGHELTHFYQQHHWNLSSFSTVFFTHSVEMTDEIKKQELDADQYGLFLTYLAGYEYEVLENILPDLIQQLYEHYSTMDRKTRVDESLLVRQDIIKNVKPMVAEFIALYEAANLLYAAGDAEAAFWCNDLLAKSINLSEVQNNKGVTGLQVVYDSLILENTSNDLLFFQYPTAVNLDFTLENYRKTTQEIFDEVIAAFKEASRIDPNNLDIKLNLACAYDLAQQHLIAKTYLTPYQNLDLPPLTKAKYLTLQAIIAAHENDLVKAKNNFALAAQFAEGYPALQKLIQQNQEIVEGKKFYQTSVSVSNSQDKIENKSLSFWGTFRKDYTYDYETDNFPPDQLYFQSLKNSARLIFLKEGVPTKIHYTKNTQHRTIKNVGVNSSYEDVQKTYSKYTHHVLLHYRGYYIVYPELSLIFNLNDNNQVVSWAIYDVSTF